MWEYAASKVVNKKGTATITINEINNYINNFYSKIRGDEIVIKYSGLAKGKGVYLPTNHAEAILSINELHQNNISN